MSGLKVPTRQAYGETLVELGKANPNIVVLDADISKSTRTELFAKAFPERFFNVGVAEQNEMGIAAGMAMCGKTVFVSTYAVFASMRACEQLEQFNFYHEHIRRRRTNPSHPEASLWPGLRPPLGPVPRCIAPWPIARTLSPSTTSSRSD